MVAVKGRCGVQIVRLSDEWTARPELTAAMWDFARKKLRGHFGFWIADFGLGIWRHLVFNPKSKIENLKSPDFEHRIPEWSYH
jgi:hypothetical protein